jgi:hypothetical protein
MAPDYSAQRERIERLLNEVHEPLGQDFVAEPGRP